jgi:hypothetical protein
MNIFRTKPKLSVQEIAQLSKAFELSLFSKTYQAGIKTPLSVTVGVSSRSILTFQKMVLSYMDEASIAAPFHYVKLTRNLAKLTKTALVKRLQDVYRLKGCRGCDENLTKESMNDSILLLSLLDFIILEQDRPENVGMTKQAAFDKWRAAANQEAIVIKMATYVI